MCYIKTRKLTTRKPDHAIILFKQVKQLVNQKIWEVFIKKLILNKLIQIKWLNQT